MPDQPDPASVTPQGSTAGDDEIVLSEEQLNAMTLHDLVQLCKENDIPLTGDVLLGGKPSVLKHLLTTFGA